MRLEVMTGVERRRRWSIDQKLQIVAEAEGNSVAEIARRHDITRQHIYQWRRELRSEGVLPVAPPVFLPVELAAPETGAQEAISPSRIHQVEIGLRNGRLIRVAADTPDRVLRRLIRIVEAP